MCRLLEVSFVDESGINTKMVRRHARAAPGERAVGHAPAGHYDSLTIVGGLSLRGLIAAMSVPGAANTDVMTLFVEQVLVPELVSGQIVFMDNLSVHKSRMLSTLRSSPLNGSSTIQPP